jgi:DNA-directed RNA polymerase specialized sigma24 family protein
MQAVSDSAELFRHVSAEKAYFYRCIMDVFAAAKRQYRLQLRPDEVLAEARWPAKLPEIEEVNAALTQLTAWGNLESDAQAYERGNSKRKRVSRQIGVMRLRYRDTSDSINDELELVGKSPRL